MELSKSCITLDELLNKNQITFKNIDTLEQNFGNLLTHSDSLCYKNCEDMTIIINSKINKIIFNNCNRINLKLSGLITGLEIKQSTDITVNNERKLPVNSVIIEHSGNIKIMLSKILHEDTIYDFNKCIGISIVDHHQKHLF